MSRAESTKEQNMTNQAMKLCYVRKAEDHEIKDCKMREIYYLDILTQDTRTQEK